MTNAPVRTVAVSVSVSLTLSPEVSRSTLDSLDWMGRR
jgi:hypothetical protein